MVRPDPDLDLLGLGDPEVSQEDEALAWVALTRACFLLLSNTSLSRPSVAQSSISLPWPISDQVVRWICLCCAQAHLNKVTYDEILMSDGLFAASALKATPQDASTQATYLPHNEYVRSVEQRTRRGTKREECSSVVATINSMCKSCASSVSGLTAIQREGEQRVSDGRQQDILCSPLIAADSRLSAWQPAPYHI
jgi:hypothetical protein